MPSTEHHSALSDCSVLLVDDCPDTRQILGYVLSQAGVQVTCANNGQECVEKAMSSVGKEKPFDMILLDIQMPVLDGHGAARALREQGYKNPIVAITARTSAGDAKASVDAGCDRHFSKLSGSQELLKMVEEFAAKPGGAEADLPVLPVVPDILRNDPQQAAAAVFQLRKVPTLLAELQRAVGQNDLAEIAGILPKLSVLSLYGYAAFAECVRGCQEAVASGSPAAIDHEFEQLERGAEAMLAGLPLLEKLSLEH